MKASRLCGVHLARMALNAPTCLYNQNTNINPT